MIESPGPTEVLIAERALAARIDALGDELADVYRNASDPPVLVGVLKGSTFFLADLIRALRVDLVLDFMSISTYTGSRPGVVRIIKDLEQDVGGRDVLIVEDIVDTGFTLHYLRRTLEQRGTRTLRAVSLLDKSARRIVPVPLEHRGFEIPDVFVVGYGLDFQGLYRNVPQLLAVRDIASLANDPRLLVGDLFPESKL